MTNFAPSSTTASLQTSAVVPQTDIITQRLALSTGVEMHYATKDPGSPIVTQASGERKAIILLPGYSDSWRSFEEMLARMPIREYPFPVYALDLRGHGQSSRAPDQVYTHRSFADDIEAFMHALNIEKAVIVGHSMGGLIAHMFAVAHPDRVEALVLMATAATMAGHPIIDELKPVVQSIPKDAPAPVEFVVEFQASTSLDVVAPSVLYRYVAESLQLEGGVWQSALDGMEAEDHRSQLPTVTAPTLVLWGDQDSVFARKEQDELIGLLPNAQLIVYPGAGHALNAERPAETVADMRAFLEATT